MKQELDIKLPTITTTITEGALGTIVFRVEYDLEGDKLSAHGAVDNLVLDRSKVARKHLVNSVYAELFATMADALQKKR